VASPTVEILFKGQNLTGPQVAAVKAGLESIGVQAKEMNTAVDGSFKGMVGSLLTANAVMAGLKFGEEMLKGVVAVNVEFQTMVSKIQAFAGSHDGAVQVFGAIEQFATKNKLKLNEVTDAWMALRIAGVQPTATLMNGFGNIAAATGKTMSDVTEGVARASEGMFRGMIQLGIKMRVDGDNIIATYNGVNTTIKNSKAAIVAYTEELGNGKFAGSMDRQAQTLQGSFNSLEESVGHLARSIGEGGLNSQIKMTADWMQKLGDSFTSNGAVVSKWTTGILDGIMVVGVTLGELVRASLLGLSSMAHGFEAVADAAALHWDAARNQYKMMREDADGVKDSFANIGQAAKSMSDNWAASNEKINHPAKKDSTGKKTGDAFSIGGGPTENNALGTPKQGQKDWTDELPAKLRKDYRDLTATVKALNFEVAKSKFLNAGIIDPALEPRIKAAGSAMQGMAKEVLGAHLKGVPLNKALTDMSGIVNGLTGDTKTLVEQGFERLIGPMSQMDAILAGAEARAEATGGTLILPDNFTQRITEDRDALLELQAVVMKKLEGGWTKDLATELDQVDGKLQVVDDRMKKVRDANTKQSAKAALPGEIRNAQLDQQDALDQQGPNAGVIDPAEMRARLIERMKINFQEYSRVLNEYVNQADQEAVKEHELKLATVLQVRVKLTTEGENIPDSAGAIATAKKRMNAVLAGSFKDQFVTGLLGAVDTVATQATDRFRTMFSALAKFQGGFAGGWKQVANAVAAVAKIMKSAMFGALADIAKAHGQSALIAAIDDFAAAFTDPRRAGAGAMHLAAAAGWFALAGGLGAAGGGGGGGGGGGAGAQNDSNKAKDLLPPTATVYIAGGLFNADDPKQARALAEAVGTLTNRRVEIRGGVR
jgi:hypothetical protein